MSSRPPTSQVASDRRGGVLVAGRRAPARRLGAVSTAPGGPSDRVLVSPDAAGPAQRRCRCCGCCVLPAVACPPCALDLKAVLGRRRRAARDAGTLPAGVPDGRPWVHCPAGCPGPKIRSSVRTGGPVRRPGGARSFRHRGAGSACAGLPVLARTAGGIGEFVGTTGARTPPPAVTPRWSVTWSGWPRIRPKRSAGRDRRASPPTLSWPDVLDWTAAGVRVGRGADRTVADGRARAS